MKKTRYIVIILVAVAAMVVTGCDKKDCNGDLDGMWQLLVWTGPEGDTIATKDSMIFYSVQLQMMKFQKTAGVQNTMMSMFEKYPAAVRIYDPQSYKGDGHDSIYSIQSLGMFGVPEDGVMRIESLSSDEMTLSSAQKGTLKFRKY